MFGGLTGGSWSDVLRTKGLKAVVDGIVDSQEYADNFGEDKVPGHKDIQPCKFPWKRIFEGDIQNSDVWSELTVSNNGRIDYHISINNRSRNDGSCVRFYIILADTDGNIMKTLGGDQFCVGPKGPLGVGQPKRREDRLDYSLSANELSQLGRVEVVFSPGGKNVLDLLKGNLQKLEEVLQSCPTCIRIAAAIAGGG